MSLTLETNAFYAGGRLPARFTCDGGDSSPPLLWSGAPSGTRSFALVCSDPDAPSGAAYHWGIYDIPAAVQRLPERYPRESGGVGPAQAVNDFGRTGYSGPCPPPRQGSRRCVFRLYALDTDRLPVASPARAQEVERAAEAHAVARAELTATYDR